MKKTLKRRLPEINSDDELSDSGPEISDDDSEVEQVPDDIEIGKVQGRSDSESDDEVDIEAYKEYEETVGGAPIPSKDAFGKHDYIGTDISDRKRRKLKRIERAETDKLEEQDADKRREELQELFAVGMDDRSDDEKEETEELPGTKTADNNVDRLKLLKRQSPELFPLINELKAYKQELNDVLIPLQTIFTEEDDQTFVIYIRKRVEIIRAYCANIVFYLRLRAKACSTLHDHPAMNRLAQLKTLIVKISSKESQDFAKAYLDVYEEERIKNSLIIKDSVENSGDESNNDALADFEEMTNGGQKTARREVVDTVVDPENLKDGKRLITYKMSKNKGLVPKRQKKRRNPRVKHRVAYADALKRRKGAVREVRKELNRYGGETTGIKLGVKKSVRTNY